MASKSPQTSASQKPAKGRTGNNTEDFLGLWQAVAKIVRPRAVVWFADLAAYLMLWTSVLVARVIRVGMLTIGVDSEVITVEAFIEKWVAIATFAAFFITVIRKAIHDLKNTETSK